ncbi:MAG: glutamyl-tRNA reductase [Bryobacteraceae bacterium]
MKLLVTGVSHKTAPVEVREGLAIPAAFIPAALDDLRAHAGVREAVILSTCNRVEITVSCEEAIQAHASIQRFLLKGRVLPPQALYSYEDRAAIQHLFRVASSLDSMIVGEPQILGQVKAAYALAREKGTVNGLLDGIFTRAFNVAKRVRSETGIGAMAVSISFAAVELARKIFGALSGKTVMIVGAGKMSELAARHLQRSGASDILVTNRTWERALQMARQFNGKPVDYLRFQEMLPEVDILISSSGAPHYILNKDEMQRVIHARRNKPMFLIDIAVPRNIDPQVNEVDNVFLYDIDDLQEVVNANLQERSKEATHAEEIVVQEVERMVARLKVQEVAPTIVSLQEQLEAIRNAELERMRRKCGPLSREMEEAVEGMTRAIVNKIAHGPISELRQQAGQPEGIHVIKTIRKVFHLG